MLSIVVNGLNIDLFGDEEITQTYSIFNFNDITSLNADFTNEFKAPLTNNNIRVCEHIDELITSSTFPYRQNNCDIYIDGSFFKNGFLEVIEIGEEISFRFYTGSINFFNLVKSIKLGQLDWSDYNHTWDLATVIASRLNTEGYIYPLIDYNGMSNSLPRTVDVRRLAPAIYAKTAIELLIEQSGYTLTNSLTGDRLNDYNNFLLPYVNKVDDDLIDANLFKVSLSQDTNVIQEVVPMTVLSNQAQITTREVYIKFDDETSGTNSDVSNLYDTGTGIYSVLQTGVYTFTYNIDIDAVLQLNFNPADWMQMVHTTQAKLELGYVFYNYGGGVTFTPINTFTGGDFNNNPNSFSITTGSVTTGQITLLQGTSIAWRLSFTNQFRVNSISTQQSAVNLDILFTQLSASSTFSNNLVSPVVFNNNYNIAFALPDMTGADLFKDVCVRFGILPIINEDDKTIEFKAFDTIIDNIGSAYDWSDKVDETDKPVLFYKLDDYAQKNYIKHKEDDTVNLNRVFSDYTLTIPNANLEVEKDLYESPFAASDTVSRLSGYKVLSLDLYDANTNQFNANNLEPRVCYLDIDNNLSGGITYTDGTTSTTVTTSLPFTHYYTSTNSSNCGFNVNQYTKYNGLLINLFKELKGLKIKLRLNIVDIVGLNYYRPVYLEQYQSYSFISEIKEFSFTSNESTEVTLIKIY